MTKEHPTSFSELPEDAKFWSEINGDNIKKFCCATIIEKIRSFNSNGHADLIAYHGSLKTLVQMIDRPDALLAIKLEQDIQVKEAEELMSLLDD